MDVGGVNMGRGIKEEWRVMEPVDSNQFIPFCLGSLCSL